MDIMMKSLVVLSLSTNAYASWFCEEGASRKQGNGIVSCGIGSNADEDEARKKALHNAIAEFNLICDESVDCQNFEKIIEPLRTECKLNGDEYKCYRAVVFYPTKRKEKLDKKQEIELFQLIVEQKESMKEVIKSESESIKQGLKAIERKIDNVKAGNTIVIKQQITSNSNRYQDCLQEYEDLLRDAREESMNNDISGDLSQGKANSLHNKALNKQLQCTRMKQ